MAIEDMLEGIGGEGRGAERNEGETRAKADISWSFEDQEESD
jgi:hypothetical protein